MVLRVHHLVGAAEIRRMLRVSRQRVDVFTRRDDFPDPVADLESGRVWERAAVEEWARAHGREVWDDGGDTSADEDQPAEPRTRRKPE